MVHTDPAKKPLSPTDSVRSGWPGLQALFEVQKTSIDNESEKKQASELDSATLSPTQAEPASY